MAVNYLQGSEQPTAALMNALIEAFDGKLAKILSNKSFILAFNTGVRGINPDLMGRCFFFTDGVNPSKFGFRCPDARVKSGAYLGTDPITGLPTGIIQTTVLHSYRHQVFTQAASQIATLNPDYRADGVVEIDAFPVSMYADGLTSIANTSLLDHSLEAHHVLKWDEQAQATKVYWIKERTVGHSERPYRYAVADIILEGVTELSFPNTWDKYACLRIHNLNYYTTAVVTFGKTADTGATPKVSIPPLGCVTVRRDRVELSNGNSGFQNYKISGSQGNPLHYFWPYEGGVDYRHYWFFPTSKTGDPSVPNVMLHDQPNVSNSMCANNLCNPSIVLDWIKELAFQQDFIDYEQRYAWFYQDPHEVRDEYAAHYQNKFGNPASPDTILGDLIHHPGEIIKVKTHKRDKFIYKGFPTEYPRTEVSSFQFKGYATIVADFAAEGISVTTNANGTYLFTQTGETADWVYSLIPIGTNLFKVSALRNDANNYWLEYPTLISLPREIEAHVFDDQKANCGVSQTPPYLIVRRDLGHVQEAKTYLTDAGRVAVYNDKILLQELAGPASQTPVWAIQGLKVSDLLKLGIWGDKNLGTQDTAATGFVNKRIVLSPWGFALLFEEQIPATYLRNVATAFQGQNGTARFFFAPDQEWQLVTNAGAASYFRRKRAIKFRRMGFGWPELGRQQSMWWSQRYGRHIYPLTNSYADENAAGKDFSFGDLPTIETDVKVLKQIRHDPDLANVAASGRFWKMADFPLGGRSMTDAFLGVYYHRQQGNEEFTFWLARNQTQLRGGRVGDLQMTGWASAPSLLPEHYNGLAQQINQLKTGKILDFTCLRFIVDWNGARYAMGIKPPTRIGTTFWAGGPAPAGLGEPAPFTQPVPVDCWKFWDLATQSNQVAQREMALYQAAGIQIRTFADLPLPTAALLWKDRKLTFKTEVALLETESPDDTNWMLGKNRITTTFDGDELVNSSTPAGTALFPDNNRRVLTQYYAGCKWVQVVDVKNWLEAYAGEFPFVFDEYFAPWSLEYLQFKGTDKPLGSKNVGSATTVKGNLFHYLTNAIQSSYREEAKLLDAELLAFVPAEDGAKATWKTPLPGAGGPPEATDLSVRDVQYWDPGQNPVYGIKTSGVGWQSRNKTQPGDTHPSYEAKAVPFEGGAVLDGFSAAASPNLPAPGQPNGGQFVTVSQFGTNDGPFVHWIFSDVDATWLKRCYDLVKTVGFQSHRSEGLTAKPNVLMVHDNFWSFEHGWINKGDVHRLFMGEYRSKGTFDIFPLLGSNILEGPVLLRAWSIPSDRGFFAQDNNTSPGHPILVVSKNLEKLAAAPAKGVNIYKADPPDAGNPHGTAYRLQIIRPWTTIEL